ncbi:hypothetical protein M486_723 [Yersinia pestis 1045]|nr:hypothetical protein M478_3630 [Yersinia pestis 2944]AKT00929.1 hypothetical protein M486_723 [Yersinia pestis 1045]
MSDSLWHLYLLRTASGMLYTGITTDVARTAVGTASGGERGKSAAGQRGVNVGISL